MSDGSRNLGELSAGAPVTISYKGAMPGLPKHLTAYAVTKAGLAHLAEGLRAKLLGLPIMVSRAITGKALCPVPIQ
jgi:hypothetical protein|tara:strand:+ start:91690 stop:91917 length:228 start_codon:yes stop_codon:yes gene_type:complete